MKMELASAPATIQSNRRSRLIRRMFSVMVAVLCMAVMMAVPMFAASGSSSAAAGGGGNTDLIKGVDSGMESLWKLLRGLSYGVAVVFVAVAAFKLIVGGQKGMEAAKSDLIKAIIFAAIIVLAPIVLSTIFNWFSTSGSGNIFKKPSFMENAG